MKVIYCFIFIKLLISFFPVKAQTQDDSDWVRYPPRKKFIVKPIDIEPSVTTQLEKDKIDLDRANNLEFKNKENKKKIESQIETLVPIDESKYDMENKQKIETSDIFNRLTKETFQREIFKVNEISKNLKTAYIVNEPVSIETTKEIAIEKYVIVTKNENDFAWAYQSQLKSSVKKYKP